MEVALNMMAVNGIINLLTSAFSLVMYILFSVGLYTIAKRRGISNAWLAWIPVGSAWILGSVSDQYQYSVKGKKTNRRKVLLGLEIALMVIVVILVIVMVVMLVQVAMIPDYDMYPDVNFASYSYEYGYEALPETEAAVSVLLIALVLLALCFVMMVISVVYTVFAYIAYYDLFASCNPSNATVFLVLSIFFGFLGSIFVFVCRNKDEGMRPQMSWQYPGYQPAYGQTGYQPPYGQNPYQPQQPPYPPAQPYCPQPPAPPVPPAQPVQPESPTQPEHPPVEPEQPL